MSDVLVKGMDMPTACRHGECNFACSAAYQTGLICIVRKQYVVPGDVPGDCPCSFVPTHGDLIDRDMAMKTIKPWTPEDERAGCTFDTVKKLMHTLLSKAPVIIPTNE